MYTFQQLPSALLGSGVTTILAGLALLGEPHLLSWLFVQGVVHVFNGLLYVAFRAGRITPESPGASWWRRAGVFTTGVGWGYGAYLWPIGAPLDAAPGWLMLFCYGGVLSGAVATLAGDRRWFLLFGVTAGLPNLSLWFTSQWWVSTMLVAYLIVMSLVCHRVGATLREALSLRFENTAMLAETLRRQFAAEQMAEQKARFLARASHDLRQPVQALSLFTDVLSQGTAVPLASRERALAALRHSADLLHAMLDSLLDVSRLDAGVVDVHEQALPLRPMLALAAEALHDEARARGIQLLVLGRPHTVWADPALLSRVIHSLAMNAVQHGEARVVLGLRRRQDRCILVISDRGAGIPEEERERIFDDLVRLAPEGARESSHGLGLGLPTVRRICQLSHWPLRLCSSPSSGTRFEVSIPLAVEGQRPSSSKAPHTATADKPLGHVLLVEPDPLVLGALRSFLDAIGWDMTAVTGADRALSTFQQLCQQHRAPDIVVTDYWLSQSVTGPRLLARLFEASSEALGAILMTADLDVPVASDGPIPVVRKPVSGPELHRLLCRVHPRREKRL